MHTVKALGANAVVLRVLSEGEQFIFSFTPVCVQCGTWFRDLEPKHFNQPCPFCSGKGCTECKGTGFHPVAASVTWMDYRFPDLLSKSVEEIQSIFMKPELPSSADRLLGEIKKRLEALDRIGLGYVSLDRPLPSLSRGESQRVRLAVALTSRLEDILYVLDGKISPGTLSLIQNECRAIPLSLLCLLPDLLQAKVDLVTNDMINHYIKPLMEHEIRYVKTV